MALAGDGRHVGCVEKTHHIQARCGASSRTRRTLLEISVPATSQACDHAGKPLQRFLPADLSSPERVFAPGLGTSKPECTKTTRVPSPPGYSVLSSPLSS